MRISASFPSRIWNASAGYVPDEPGHVRHTFSGIPGHVPEDRGRGNAGHASGILRGAGGLFPVLYLPVPPVVPECVQTAGKQRLYAVMRGLYHAYPAVHGKGPGQGPAQFAIVVISAALAWLVPISWSGYGSFTSFSGYMRGQGS